MPWTAAAHAAARVRITVPCCRCGCDTVTTTNRKGMAAYCRHCLRARRVERNRQYRQELKDAGIPRQYSEREREQNRERGRRYRRAMGQVPLVRQAYIVISDPGPWPLVAGLGIEACKQGVAAMLQDGCFNAGTVLELGAVRFVVVGEAGTVQTLEVVK